MTRPAASGPPLAVLAPGYGATAEQPLLLHLSALLEAEGVRAVRVTLPRRRRPSPGLGVEAEALEAALDAAALGAARGRVALVGRSFGGRVCTALAVRRPPDALVVIGYPIRPPGRHRPDDERALAALRCPTLILQGDRDQLGPLRVLRRVVQDNPRVQLKVLEGAGHSLGRHERPALEEAAAWVASRLVLSSRRP